jgi:hypothetical protein
MEYQAYAFIDATSSVQIDASVTGKGAWVSAQTFERITDWTLKPEGLCCGDVCIPGGDAVAGDGSIDLAGFSALTNRSLVLDESERAMSLGAAAEDRSTELGSLKAPDFSLPDLNGKMHRLSDYRGVKILLAAYASW